MVGKVGKDLTEEEAYTAAQLCGLNMIATLKSASLARLQWRSRTLAHQRRALPLHPLIVFDTILILSPPSNPAPVASSTQPSSAIWTASSGSLKS